MDIELLLLVAPVLLFSMVAHEYAHGYAAWTQGDDTALLQGRLTWNPLRHIDPMMTLIVPALTWMTYHVAFGGAKPVQILESNFTHRRRGGIIVALAGVSANALLALLFVPVVIALGAVGRALPPVRESAALLQVMFSYGININLVLAAFNLLPIPPLDGSHVVRHLLPAVWALRFQRVAPVGFLVLLALLTVGRPVLSAWMRPVTTVSGLFGGVLAPHILPSKWTT